MSLLRIKELEAQLARRDERIKTLELELNTAAGANIMLRRELADTFARQDRRPTATNVELALKFEGFDLVVRGDHTPREWSTPHHPGHPADFDVTEVYLVDPAIDVSELFDADALAIAVLEHMREEAESCEETT